MKTVEGTPCSSTSRGEWELVPRKTDKLREFSFPLHAGPGDVPKGASPSLGGGVNAFFYASYHVCQSEKNRKGLLKLLRFQCIGGGNVPPPMSCQTLGQAMRRKVRCLGLGGGVNAFFGIVSCWQSVKNHEGLLKLRGFHCIGAGSAPPPMSC